MKTPRILAVVLALTLAAHGAITEFASTGGFTINDNANATPYPSSVTVSGISGVVNGAWVKTNGFSHTYPADDGTEQEVRATVTYTHPVFPSQFFMRLQVTLP